MMSAVKIAEALVSGPFKLTDTSLVEYHLAVSKAYATDLEYKRPGRTNKRYVQAAELALKLRGLK